MRPFTSQMSEGGSRKALVFTAAPFAILGLLVWWMLQDSPSSTFRQYQDALTYSDWEKVRDLSDETTVNYLESLDQWVWAATSTDLDSLPPFQKYLVLTSRSKIIDKGLGRPAKHELLGIWMEALNARELIIKSKIVNRYNFGEVSIGQLFLAASNSDTGRQIRFTKEANWKIETIALIKEIYETAELGNNLPILKKSYSRNFRERYALERHGQAKVEPDIKHTL